jgi:hypothetical protein
MYGLDAVEVVVGVGTRTASNHPSDRLRDSLDRNESFARRLRDGGATVLEGHLVQRGGAFEEKQVDVLCALAIADAADRIQRNETPAQCVVVLSEDMDLMPAIEFAESRGVAAYAAAYDTVHLRPDQKKWLLLHESALRAICDPPGRVQGAKLRQRLADFAMDTQNAMTMQWKVIAPKMDDGRALLSNNLGLNGLWRPDRALHRGDKIDLYVSGVEMDPHTGRFPFALLSRSKPQRVHRELEVADVLHWSNPTQVKVRLRGTGLEASLRAAPGSLQPAQEVAVLHEARGTNVGRYLVGARGELKLPTSWPTADPVVRVVLDEPPSAAEGAWARATMVESGVQVGVKAGLLDHATAGSNLMVAAAGSREDGLPITMPLTCCLPTVR